MKKTLLLAALIAGIMVAGTSYAGSVSLGKMKVNVNTPAKTTTTTATSTAKSANAAKMQSQIAALDKQLTSVSSSYQATVNDLVNNLLPADEVAKFKEKVAKLKSSEKGAELNIDIAEDGTIALNKSLKSPDINAIKNLPAAKKAAIKKDLAQLKNTTASFNTINKQAVELAASIKGDPLTALSLHSELLTLTKDAKSAATEVKNITKLTSTITNAFAKAGVKL